MKTQHSESCNTAPIQHSEGCNIAPIRKRCKTCILEYHRKADSRRRIKKKEKIIRTRSKVKKLKYEHLLCVDCKDKNNTKLCNVCRLKCRNASNKDSRDRIKKLKNMQCNVDLKQNCQNPFSSNKNISECNKGEKVSDTKRKKKVSRYVHLLCNECKEKTLKQYCRNCIRKYKCAEMKDRRLRKKLCQNMQSKNNIGQGCQKPVKRLKADKPLKDSFSDINTMNSPRKYKEKTIANATSKFRKSIAKSPTKITQVISKVGKSLPEEHQLYLSSIFGKKSVSNVSAKICGELVNTLKVQSPKSDLSYRIYDGVSDVFKNQSVTSIKKTCRLGYNKAKKLKYGKEIRRKVNKRRLPLKTINKVEAFYLRDEISRIDMSTKKATKLGHKIYMNFPVRVAYKLFTEENPGISISYSKFHLLKPVNVKISAVTPWISCLCKTCQNVLLKLIKLNLPKIKSVYELYNYLICEKEDLSSFVNKECVFKECEKCKHWEDKIKSFLPRGAEELNSITWYSWEKSKIEGKNGKPVVKMVLQHKTGTYAKCIEEFIQKDIMNPGENYTFIQHYFTQYYQLKMLTACRNSLKVGECLIIQDFAKNRDILYQDEIKSRFWSNTQCTIHPQVIFIPSADGVETKRLVITHLSDVTSHDAHFVYHMTNECLTELAKDYLIKKAYIWSDGCSAQYKGKHSFYYLDKHKEDVGVDVERHFFGSDHGKGESDTETGLISKKLSCDIRSRNVVITNASDMHKHLSKCHENDNSRFFKLVTESDLAIIHEKFDGVEVKTLEGKCTRTLHHIKPSGLKGVLLTRPFSCFCRFCLNDEYEQCLNKSYTLGKFTKNRLPIKKTSAKYGKYDESFDDDDDDYDEIDDAPMVLNDNDFDYDYDSEYDEYENMSEILIEKEQLQIDDIAVKSFVVAALLNENTQKKILLCS